MVDTEVAERRSTTRSREQVLQDWAEALIEDGHRSLQGTEVEVEIAVPSTARRDRFGAW